MKIGRKLYFVTDLLMKLTHGEDSMMVPPIILTIMDISKKGGRYTNAGEAVRFLKRGGMKVRQNYVQLLPVAVA